MTKALRTDFFRLVDRLFCFCTRPIALKVMLDTLGLRNFWFYNAKSKSALTEGLRTKPVHSDRNETVPVTFLFHSRQLETLCDYTLYV
ncbi:uncharacterized protein N7483_002595 [Penicillium malachiteum]|uniref:uncharacterized protein n=1 Tax=Penicillium malachiteum TaxID=1324776 RepID=UPI002548EA5E|nr:uncharacterized protein N7483_002595 [Penicillium malachiteum]KAJ5737470.1 hypothetical protein N7483_002595 [Penicillium malachiteum]